MVFGLFRRKPAVNAAAAAIPVPDPPASSAQDPRPSVPDEAGTLPVPVAPHTVGPPLWQDVAYGMTPDEVRRTRADAVPAVDPQLLGDGTASLLQITSLQLADHDYSVQFYFKDSRLTQVTIATNGGPSAADFDGIANALRLCYGREVAFKDSPDSFSTGEWLSADGVNVSLVFHEAIGCLNVNFQHRYAEVAMQL